MAVLMTPYFKRVKFPISVSHSKGLFDLSLVRGLNPMDRKTEYFLTRRITVFNLLSSFIFLFHLFGFDLCVLQFCF